MEQRSNPFNELHDRLYAAAAAGTSVIAEDFRLKRAVEAFEPLAQKNKVFARLHKMCAGLFTSANAAADIADCIALADALAVTQAAFADDSQTVPPPESSLKAAQMFTSHEIPYSKLEELKTAVLRAKNNAKVSYEEIAAYADDPRLVSAYLSQVNSNSETADRLSMVFEKACGKALAEPLFDSIDLTNTRAGGRQIDYITRIAGDEYNERFKIIARDDNAAANIRVKAINALSRDPENADLLIELYQTNKGKVQSAALLGIAKLSPPEGEPIFDKLAAKFKADYLEAFSEASYPACSGFARSELERWKALAKDDKYRELTRISRLLCNKTDVYDCLEYLAHINMKDDGLLERILLVGLKHTDKPEFAEMVEQLYRRYPEKIFFARLILEIQRSNERAFDILAEDCAKYMEQLNRFLGALYSTPDGHYRIALWGGTDLEYHSPVLFDSVPDSLLKLITEMKLAERNKPEWFCAALKQLYEKCLPADRKRVRQAAVKLSYACLDTFPNYSALEILVDNGIILPDGAIQAYIITHMRKFGKVPQMYVLTFGAGTEEFLYGELTALAQTLPKMKNEFSQQLINSALTDTARYIKWLEQRIK